MSVILVIRTDEVGSVDLNSIKVPEHISITKKMMLEYQRNARTVKIGWHLTFEEFKHIISQACHYCGAPPKKKVVHMDIARGRADYYVFVQVESLESVNGVDRVSSHQGYHIANCRPCCSACNQAKNDRSADEFAKHIKLIYSRLNDAND